METNNSQLVDKVEAPRRKTINFAIVNGNLFSFESTVFEQFG